MGLLLPEFPPGSEFMGIEAFSIAKKSVAMLAPRPHGVKPSHALQGSDTIRASQLSELHSLGENYRAASEA